MKTGFKSKQKTEKTGAEKVRWDLSVMYKGIDDPRLDLDIKKILKGYARFKIAYKGKLSLKLDAALSDYIELKMLDQKIGYFLRLQKSVDLENVKVKAKAADVGQTLSYGYGEYMEFFTIELTALSENVLKKFYSKNRIIREHRPWIEFVRMFKPHMLGEPVEGALTKRASFGPTAWAVFCDEVETSLRFKHKGKEKTLEELLDGVSNSLNNKERAELLEILDRGLAGSFASYSAQTLYMTAGAQAIETRERGYRHPMEHRNKSNQVVDRVVDQLHWSVTEEARPLVRRYYRLKAAHLGLKVLAWSDRNAPMPFKDKAKIQFSEATDIVLNAYHSFSPTIYTLLNEKVIKAHHVDAPLVPGKSGGAYCASSVLPGHKPEVFVFLNYKGSGRSVMTYAHELGHAAHGLLAGQAQGVLMGWPPMAYAETASIFGEKITFNFLREKLKDDPQTLLALIMDKIDDILNTVVRQIGFSNFERRIHGMDAEYKVWGKPKKLSVSEINTIWKITLEELYGKEGEIFSYKHADHLWSYVSHFHSPFYVYSYAFGQLLTENIYAQREGLGQKFEPLYLELLKSGSTKNAVELLKPFGLDPMKRLFWANGIGLGLGALIKEAEDISKELGMKV